MINNFKKFTLILDLIILFAFFLFTGLFFLNIKIIFLSNFLIYICIFTLLIKLLKWYLFDKSKKFILKINKSSILLKRLSFCIFLYITPVFYLIQFPQLIISEYVISITLIIISILIFSTVLIENFNKTYNLRIFNEKK